MNYLMLMRDIIVEYTERQLVQEYGIEYKNDDDSDTTTNNANSI